MPDPRVTGQDLLVLHTVRCIGVAGTERIAYASGLTEADAESALIDLAVDGLMTRVPGAFAGWALTEAGRRADAASIADELDAAGGRAAVAHAYDEFLVLNPVALDLCTAWQTRTDVGGPLLLNDHSDHAYDAGVLDRLTELDRRADGVLTTLSAAAPRFDRYRVRLTHALARARAGDREYVTDGMASYHAVWFQLHEDLLATLGIPRF